MRLDYEGNRMLANRRSWGADAITSVVTAAALTLLMGFCPSSAASHTPVAAHATKEGMVRASSAAPRTPCRPGTTPTLAELQRYGAGMRVTLAELQRYGGAAGA